MLLLVCGSRVYLPMSCRRAGSEVAYSFLFMICTKGLTACSCLYMVLFLGLVVPTERTPNL